MDRGKIVDRDRARQIIDFSGLKYGKITPTDIDGMIEYHDKGYIIYETKYDGAVMPRGQELALERISNELKKPSIIIVSDHNHPIDEDIDIANSLVRKIFYAGKWNEKHSGMTVKEVTDKFINYLDEFGG